MPPVASVTSRETGRTGALLHRLAAALSSARTSSDVLDVILDEPAASLGADGSFVMLLDEARGELWPAFATGISKAEIARVMPCPIAAHAPSADALRRRGPVLVDSLETLTRLYPAIAPAAREAGYRALAHTPLQTGRRVLGVLGLAFRTAREFSSRHQRELRAIGRFCGDALYRAELYESEIEARAEIARLSRRLVSAQEDQRRRIARELHDEIGQALTLAMLVTTDRRRQPTESLVETRNTVARALDRLRDLLNDLHPRSLTERGLLPTLLNLFDRFERQTYIAVEFTHKGIGRRYDPDVELAVFRIAQEALTNVARHAGVHRVKVHAAGTATRLRLEVADQGVGFAPAARRRTTTLGVPGLHERAMALGGEVRVESAPRRGTRVIAELPARPKGSVPP